MLPGDWNSPDRVGVCAFMRDPDKGLDCLARSCFGGAAPSICVYYGARHHRECPLYYRMAALAGSFPELWADGVYCEMWRFVALRCMEADGCMAGALDILHRPNDGKIVWRNFERCEFVYCPFCGRRLEKK